MRRRRARLLLLAISLGLLLACQSSPEAELRQIHQELASWNATERLTAELVHRGALPETYVRQVSEAVAQGREQARQQAAKLSQ